MTWQRMWQTGFEMGKSSECDFADGLRHEEEFSQTEPITGDFSRRYAGPYSGVGHLFTTNPTMIRAGIMMKTEWGLSLLDIFTIEVRSGGQREVIIFRWYPTELKLRLFYYRYADDTVTDQQIVDSTAEYGFFSDGTDMAIGIVAETAYPSGWVSVYINGQKVLSIDTSPNNVVTAFYAIKVGECATISSGLIGHIDDFYIDYSTISETDSCPPTRRFVLQRPRADGTYFDWTPRSGGTNHEEVDDIVSSDNEYNYTAVNGNEDTYDMDVLSLPSNSTIVSVIPIARAKAGTAGPQNSLRFNTYGSTVTVGTSMEIRLGYTYLYESQILAPSGGSWTEAEFNTCEFGYELRV